MPRCTRCNEEVTSGYVLCSRCYERMNALREAAVMQEEYRRLTAEKKLSKKGYMCVMCTLSGQIRFDRLANTQDCS